jgi:DNA-binding transcriptional regulator YiaG
MTTIIREWPEYRSDGSPWELLGTDDDVCGFSRDPKRVIVRRKGLRPRRRPPTLSVQTAITGVDSIRIGSAGHKKLAAMTGAEIRAIRKSLRLTQSRFAALLGVHGEYIGQRENSPHPLTRETLLARLHAIRRAGCGRLP